MGVRIMGISGLAFGNFETKWHLGACHVAKHRVYYKGKVVASPKSCESVFARGSSVHENASTMH